MPGENIERLRAVYAEWAKGNLRAGLDMLDPHIVYINRPGLFVTGTCYGLGEMQQWMRDFLRQWGRYEAHATEFIESGDTVVVAFRQVAVGSGSGVASEMSSYAVWTFRAGTAVRLEKMADRGEALEAAGLAD